MAALIAETGARFWKKYENHHYQPFLHKVKKLKKKYPNIKNDLIELLTNMENAKVSGVPIPGLFNKVYKIRAASSDMKRGKSGAYRIVYYAEDGNGKLYLLTIYAKTKRVNIPITEIQSILKELDLKFR